VPQAASVGDWHPKASPPKKPVDRHLSTPAPAHGFGTPVLGERASPTPYADLQSCAFSRGLCFICLAQVQYTNVIPCGCRLWTHLRACTVCRSWPRAVKAAEKARAAPCQDYAGRNQSMGWGGGCVHTFQPSLKNEMQEKDR